MSGLRGPVIVALVLVLCASALGAGGLVAAAPAAFGQWLGVYPAGAFRLATGRCTDCPVPAAALWYFRDELIAVPRVPTPGVDPDRPEFPVAIWIGAPDLITGARLAANRDVLTRDGAVPFGIVPPIPQNTWYVDESTFAFFERRSVRLRGTHAGEAGSARFVARTIWPEDARLDAARLAARPLATDETLADLVRAQVSALEDPFAARLLWERRDGSERAWAGRPVIAFVLSGAESLDAGAQAGHLGVATGYVGEAGEWADWLVNNFYPLDDDPPAKGIVSAAVPMDNYLADLNSGQAFYRPVYVLVAVLDDEAVVREAQRHFNGTFLRYYCRDFEFDRARLNSTEMAVESLRDAGWSIPRRGPTSRVIAPFAYLGGLVTGGVGRGAEAFGFFANERTHLFPRAAFEEAGADLLALAQEAREAHTSFERRLADGLRAVVFMRFPQIPSSRAFGTYPAASITGYWERVRGEGMGQSDDSARRALPSELMRSCPAPAAGPATIEGPRAARPEAQAP